MDKELIKQAFDDLAEEMESQCGNWQEIPNTEADVKLRERIMTEAIKREEEKK